MKLRRVVARAVLVFGGLVVGVVLAELVVRVFELGPDVMAVSHETFQFSGNPVLRYELKPGAIDGGDRISAQGLRDRLYATPKPDGTFRISVVGDSIAYGYGLTQEETISRQLEAVFRDRGLTDVEVLNFGVTAYNIEQVVEQCRTKVTDAEADLILNVYLLNDLQDYSFEWETLRSKLSEAERGFMNSMSGGGGLRLARLLRYVIASYQSEPAEDRKVAYDPGIMAMGAGKTVDYFRSLYDREGVDRLPQNLGVLAGEFETPVVVVIFPILDDLNHYGLGDVHQVVAEAAVERDLPVIDLLDTFKRHIEDGGIEFRIDGLHPNALGARVAVESMADELISGKIVVGR
jgi:lysophospholipase L1-like esterase